MRYPIDNLLRDPVELVPAVCSLGGALALLLFPSFFALTPIIALALAITLLLHGVWRLAPVLRLVRYQRRLEAPQTYVIQPDQIPRLQRELFLGRGFRWSARHTQRWHDLQRHEDKLAMNGKGAAGSRAGWFERLQREGVMASVSHLIVRHRPVSNEAQQLGGSLGLHGIEPDESAVHLNMSERPGHMLVLGTTRVGKSRLLELLVAQDIHRGDVVVVLDPKGDIGVLQRMYAEAERAGRTDSFYIFHLGYPELSARYNPLGDFSRVTEIADRVANGVPGSGDAAAFKQFAWHFVNGAMRAVVALGERPTYRSLRQHLLDSDHLAQRYLEHLFETSAATHSWRDDVAAIRPGQRAGGDRELRERNQYVWSLINYYQHKQLQDEVAESVIGLVTHPRQHFDKMVASLKPLVEKLTSGRAGELISPDYADAADTRPIIDWTSVIANGGIVYVGLDALSSTSVASAVGSAMLADLTNVASRIYKQGIDNGQSERLARRPLSIHADEFNELIGDEFIPLINKAGGAGFQVVAYSQTAADIEAKIGGPAKARQIEGNFNTRIYLRVLDDLTSKSFTQRLNDVFVASTTAVSIVADNSSPEDFKEFSSSNEDRLTVQKVPMLEPGDLGKLPKGQAFALLNGNHLYKLRIPLIETKGDPYFYESIEDIARRIARRYAFHKPVEAVGTPSVVNSMDTTA